MGAMMHNASQVGKCQMHHGMHYAHGMEKPADRLKRARSDAGYANAKEAAEAMGISVPTYIQHENGTRGFPATKAEKYARFFRVTPEFLLYGKRSAKPSAPGLGPTLFIKGSVSAGVWHEADHRDESEWQTFTGAPDVDAPLKDRFGVIVEGDSMDLLYPPGTILECVKNWGDKDIPSGKRVIVQRKRVDDGYETTVKEYVQRDNGECWLVPRSSNPAHQAFRCDQPEPGIAYVQIIAVVVASIRYEH